MANFNIRFGRASRNRTLGVQRKTMPLWGAILFGGVFVIVGSVFLYIMAIAPLMRHRESSSWVRTPCTILTSKVHTNPGDSDSGPTFKIQVTYEYTVGGKRYTSDQYDLFDFASSGYESKREVVRQLPPGHKTICYVDPANPSRAIMNRELDATIWIGLFPLLFIIVGFFAMIAMLRSRRKNTPLNNISPMSSSAILVDYLPSFDLAGPSRELRTGRGRWFGVIFMTIFATIWNGVTWTFVINMFNDHHGPETFGLLFMIPFVLVGLGTLGAVGYFFLQALNPRPVVSLSPSTLRPGTSLEVRWSFPSGAGKVQRLTIALVGTESATYRQGTNTRTDTSTFMNLPLIDTSSPSEIASGQAIAMLPIPLMHSLKLSNNSIAWKIQFRGEIPKWPDIKDDYDVVLLPGNWPTR